MTSATYQRPPVLDGHPETRFWTKAGPVDAELLREGEIEEIGERREAAISEPGAMALFGFAVGTLIVAWPISGFVPPGTLVATIPPVLVFAGIAQFIGGLIAFRRGNAFAGTAFCAYGANNAVVATFFLLQSTGAIPTAPGAPASIMLGLELLCFAYVSLILAAAAVRLNLAYVLILIALVPGFAMAGMHSIYGAGIPGWVGHVGGYCLIASAAFAFYTASAIVLNSTWKVSAIPLLALHRQLRPRELARRDAAAVARTSTVAGRRGMATRPPATGTTATGTTAAGGVPGTTGTTRPVTGGPVTGGPVTGGPAERGPMGPAGEPPAGPVTGTGRPGDVEPPLPPQRGRGDTPDGGPTYG